ncbi:hypothetical protein QR680_017929 [Steinernema hermaphroditum]|uniref:Uncharacterized protein n=1 Tax=Steinernema hermaphroditum TaxID=289476 RepID=A0AA39LQ69_9BILA|nr:hypothetical protein QR680_017929 [Steinernema hermaphroditum]
MARTTPLPYHERTVVVRQYVVERYTDMKKVLFLDRTEFQWYKKLALEKEKEAETALRQRDKVKKNLAKVEEKNKKLEALLKKAQRDIKQLKKLIRTPTVDIEWKMESESMVMTNVEGDQGPPSKAHRKRTHNWTQGEVRTQKTHCKYCNADEKIMTLEEIIQQLTEDNQRLQNAKFSENESTDRLMSILANRIFDCELKKSLDETIYRLSGCVDSLESRHEVLHNEMYSISQNLVKIQEELRNGPAEIGAKLETLQSQIEGSISLLKEDFDLVKKLVDDCSSSAERMERQFQEKLDDFNQQLAGTRVAVETLQTRVNTSDGHMASMEKMLGELTEANGRRREEESTELNDLKEKCSLMEARLSALKATQEDQIEVTTKRVDQLERWAIACHNISQRLMELSGGITAAPVPPLGRCSSATGHLPAHIQFPDATALLRAALPYVPHPAHPNQFQLIAASLPQMQPPSGIGARFVRPQQMPRQMPPAP